MISIEKRTRFLQDYMNGLFTMNDVVKIKLLFSCALFEDFMDLISKYQIYGWNNSVENALEIKRYSP